MQETFTRARIRQEEYINSGEGGATRWLIKERVVNANWRGGARHCEGLDKIDSTDERERARVITTRCDFL